MMVHEVDPSSIKNGVVIDDIRRCSYCKRNDNVLVGRFSVYADIKGIPHVITCCANCFCNNPKAEESFRRLNET